MKEIIEILTEPIVAFLGATLTGACGVSVRKKKAPGRSCRNERRQRG